MCVCVFIHAYQFNLYSPTPIFTCQSLVFVLNHPDYAYTTSFKVLKHHPPFHLSLSSILRPTGLSNSCPSSPKHAYSSMPPTANARPLTMRFNTFTSLRRLSYIYNNNKFRQVPNHAQDLCESLKISSVNYIRNILKARIIIPSCGNAPVPSGTL